VEVEVVGRNRQSYLEVEVVGRNRQSYRVVEVVGRNRQRYLEVGIASSQQGLPQLMHLLISWTYAYYLRQDRLKRIDPRNQKLI
jgi:hypothetical protein